LGWDKQAVTMRKGPQRSLECSLVSESPERAVSVSSFCCMTNSPTLRDCTHY
jgi:hypothetical protein